MLDYLYRRFVDQPAFACAVQLALPRTAERTSKAAEARQVEVELAQVEKDTAKLVKAILDRIDAPLLMNDQTRLKARKEALTARRKELAGELAAMPDPEAVKEEADSIRCVLATEHTGKDWRNEKWEDIRRFLHLLFGDNPKREGLGVYVDKQDGRWTTEIRARLRLRGPLMMVADPDLGFGYGHLVGSHEGEPAAAYEVCERLPPYGDEFGR